ncbi:MAG: nitroreductase family protein [Clostridia bacterium]|nr:nitroreductase family protein [Clostridia bacterium]
MDCPLNGFYSPAQCARYLSVLSGRYSCRTYAGGPDQDQLSALNYTAARVCLPGIRIVIADCPEKLFVHVPLVEPVRGTDKYACIIADMSRERARTLAGISGEAFILEAAAMGVNTCWVSGTYRRKAIDIPLKKGERILAVTPLGIAASADSVPMPHRKKMSQICRTAPEAWPHWAFQAAEAVRRAPSAINRQPWMLSYAQRTLRLLGNPADSLDMGIAMLHMEASAGNLRRSWQWGEGRCVAHLTALE